MDDVALGDVRLNLLVALGAAVVLIVAGFGVAARRGRYDTVDTLWGLGFAVIAAVSFGLSTGHGDLVARLLSTVLTVVWGLRLAVHIHRRNRGKDEDPRYTELLAKGGDRPKTRMFVRVYLTQAVLMWVVSLPVQVGQYGGGPGIVGYVGVLVWAVGLTFEAVGDLQLSRFRADPASKGQVLNTGLWRYTRHPNYFGDACVWWGLYLLACHSWVGVATGVAPIVMTALLAKGTGKPLLEKDIAQRRPGYADYVRSTSGFFPLPPKKG
jgi:steroid 5-alpha reductase family enzyme